MGDPESGELRVLVGTKNEHKLGEIRIILGTAGSADAGGPGAPGSKRDGPKRYGERHLRLSSAADLPSMEPVEENGDTFAENATIKARAFARAAVALPRESRPQLVIADDSGLCVDALEGAPGVHSARYAGLDASDADNNEKLLRELVGVKQSERSAEFVCTIACARVPDATENEAEILFLVKGRAQGEILSALHGNAGFGYDPLFYYPPLDKTFAELGDEKHRVSHRSEALARLQEALEEHAPRLCDADRQERNR